MSFNFVIILGHMLLKIDYSRAQRYKTVAIQTNLFKPYKLMT